ncbi:unnamed protein product [Lampetra fluviatilis]
MRRGKMRGEEGRRGREEEVEERRGGVRGDCPDRAPPRFRRSQAKASRPPSLHFPSASAAGDRSTMGFWDKADNADPLQKTVEATKMGAIVGALGTAYYLSAFESTTTAGTLMRFGAGTAGIAALGAIFSVGTCLSAQVLNEPDNAFNHFVGGCSAGLALGTRAHSFSVASMGCVTLGSLGVLAKVGHREGWRFIAPALTQAEVDAQAIAPSPKASH